MPTDRALRPSCSEVDIRGRRDFSRYLTPPPGRPLTLANLARPWSEDLFVK